MTAYPVILPAFTLHVTYTDGTTEQYHRGNLGAATLAMQEECSWEGTVRAHIVENATGAICGSDTGDFAGTQ